MTRINNAFYSELGHRWFEGDEHAIALLRAESVIKVDYVLEVLQRERIGGQARVLDVACGGGLVALPIAAAGHRVKGIDLATGAVESAQSRIPPGSEIEFAVGDAYRTGEPAEAYDAILLLDMLEHVEQPADVLAEAARCLRPGGVVIFHTFNRTLLARLLAIYGMRIVARDTPPDVHVYELFITPDELAGMTSAAELELVEVQGIRPVVDTAFWSSVFRRRIHPDFAFVRTRSDAVGYMGYAMKPASPQPRS